VPEAAAVEDLPAVLHAAGILAGDHRLHVLDAAGHGAGLALQGSFAPADQAGLVGFDLDEDEDAMAAVSQDRFDAGDFHKIYPSPLSSIRRVSL